jgi:hypothetical protein
MNIRNGKGKPQSNPPGSSYPVFMTMRDDLARKELNLSPEEAQAKSWAGFQPKEADVKKYSRAHIMNIGDRVLVTARLTGRDPNDVWRGLLRNGIPTAGVSASQLLHADDEE